MKNLNLILGIAGVFAILAAIILFTSAFIVTEINQAVITQFGRPVHVIAGESDFSNYEQLQANVAEYEALNNTSISLSYGAGLYFKLPFIQNVETYDDRILEYDADPALITTADKKRLLLDNFARWYIYDPLRFRQRFTTQTAALNRIDNIIFSAIRDTLGQYDFIEIIRTTNNILTDTESEIPNQKRIEIQYGRTILMEQVTKISRESALEFGIHIVDVRIKRADLPPEVQQSVFQNMIAERERIATRYREEGNRDATFIKSETDRTVKTMIAEARREEQIIMGEADAEAARIYASGFVKEVTGAAPVNIEGYQSDPEFFRFYRSLEALRMSLDGQTTLLLNPDNELLQYLNSPTLKGIQ